MSLLFIALVLFLIFFWRKEDQIKSLGTRVKETGIILFLGLAFFMLMRLLGNQLTRVLISPQLILILVAIGILTILVYRLKNS